MAQLAPTPDFTALTTAAARDSDPVGWLNARRGTGPATLSQMLDLIADRLREPVISLVAARDVVDALVAEMRYRGAPAVVSESSVRVNLGQGPPGDDGVVWRRPDLLGLAWSTEQLQADDTVPDHTFTAVTVQLRFAWDALVVALLVPPSPLSVVGCRACGTFATGARARAWVALTGEAPGADGPPPDRALTVLRVVQMLMDLWGGEHAEEGALTVAVVRRTGRRLPTACPTPMDEVSEALLGPPAWFRPGAAKRLRRPSALSVVTAVPPDLPVDRTLVVVTDDSGEHAAAVARLAAEGWSDCGTVVPDDLPVDALWRPGAWRAEGGWRGHFLARPRDLPPEPSVVTLPVAGVGRVGTVRDGQRRLRAVVLGDGAAVAACPGATPDPVAGQLSVAMLRELAAALGATVREGDAPGVAWADGLVLRWDELAVLARLAGTVVAGHDWRRILWLLATRGTAVTLALSAGLGLWRGFATASGIDQMLQDAYRRRYLRSYLGEADGEAFFQAQLRARRMRDPIDWEPSPPAREPGPSPPPPEPEPEFTAMASDPPPAGMPGWEWAWDNGLSARAVERLHEEQARVEAAIGDTGVDDALPLPPGARLVADAPPTEGDPLVYLVSDRPAALDRAVGVVSQGRPVTRVTPVEAVWEDHDALLDGGEGPVVVDAAGETPDGWWPAVRRLVGTARARGRPVVVAARPWAAGDGSEWAAVDTAVDLDA